MNIYRDAVVYDAKEHHYDVRVEASQSVQAVLCTNVRTKIEVAFFNVCHLELTFLTRFVIAFAVVGNIKSKPVFI